jgi:hypothetical protein
MAKLMTIPPATESASTAYATPNAHKNAPLVFCAVMTNIATPNHANNLAPLGPSANWDTASMSTVPLQIATASPTKSANKNDAQKTHVTAFRVPLIAFATRAHASYRVAPSHAPQAKHANEASASTIHVRV